MSILIFNHGGGGGVSLKIVGGTTQPTGAENLIWLNTATAFSKVTVDDTAPASPVAGDVYIELDAASAAVVQLGKGSRIVMLPLGIAYQYQSGAWVSLDAYAYLSGSWVTFSTDIPDGDTVAPVNDTNTWLRCAGISPSAEGNPTLAQVVASATLCATLMSSANAVNYLIRSTAIQTAVLGSATAILALDNSSPFVTPDMTSNSQGGCATDNYMRVGANQQWTQPVGVGSVMIIVPEMIWAYKVKWVAYSTYWNGEYPEANNCSVVFQGSSDGSTWINLYSKSDSHGTYTLSPSATTARFSHFRMVVTGSSIGASANNGQQLGLFKIWGKTREVAA